MDNDRSLHVLRALIDTVDREILQLLARRNAFVGEIASFKREHRVPIRDRQREQQILSDRCHRAVPLGLSPQVIENIFRLVMWASRDRQAALKAEVPLDVEPRTIAVIGGKGAMGRCMAQLFGDLGHAVMIADLDTPLTPEEATANADVVVISVPIDDTIAVVQRLGPLVRKDALLMDVTSVKVGPMQAMLDCTSASVIGTHPLFGPSVHTLQGQRIVLTPAPGAGGDASRSEPWLAWLRQILTSRGLQVVEATPAEHDKAMAIVQVLTHFSTEVLGRAFLELDASVRDLLAFSSPVYLMELIMTARHFAQSPDLYSSIQMANPETPAVTAAFVAAAQEWKTIIGQQDRHAFRNRFLEVRTHLGDFTVEALEQSSYLIDRLVERT